MKKAILFMLTPSGKRMYYMSTAITEKHLSSLDKAGLILTDSLDQAYRFKKLLDAEAFLFQMRATNINNINNFNYLRGFFVEEI